MSLAPISNYPLNSSWYTFAIQSSPIYSRHFSHSANKIGSNNIPARQTAVVSLILFVVFIQSNEGIPYIRALSRPPLHLFWTVCRVDIALKFIGLPPRHYYYWNIMDCVCFSVCCPPSSNDWLHASTSWSSNWGGLSSPLWICGAKKACRLVFPPCLVSGLHHRTSEH